MALDFSVIKTAVAAQFHQMQKHTLYRTAVDGGNLWETYLEAFADGDNPLYRERTEHDCSGCRSFIKNIGNVATIENGELVSLWDVTVSEPGYQTVVNALSAYVKSYSVENLFLHTEPKVGTDKNFEEILGRVTTYQHFFVNLPKSVVLKGTEIGPKLSEARSTHDVMLRGLTEITPEAIATVLDLISQSSLYRGEEHKFVVSGFEKIKREFDALPSAEAKDRFVWMNLTGTTGSTARIRSTVIGTLLTDLSEGKEIEDAVKSFEAKVAPQNYKRPTALVTKSMIADAQKKIEALGLMSALERRHAVLQDITINNVLHANRAVKKALGGTVFDALASEVAEKPKNYDKVESVTIDKFIADVLPRAETIEVLLENRHAPNLVTLIAPVDPTAGRLFKWDNNFSWDYNGGLADSDIRQAVQARGGRVDGVFRFSHSWNHHTGKRNSSLMDLHVFMPGNSTEPTNGVHENYGAGPRVGWNNRSESKSGGRQDVDYTPPAPKDFVPVENITFPTLAKMPEGTYICKVHNWSARTPTTSGFSAEIEFGGQVFQYDYPKPLSNHEWVTVAEVTLKNGAFTIKHHLPESTTSRVLWDMPTQTFQTVKALMLSPNHWDGQGVGNRHYFFMLEGTKQEGTARGFYNEFLKSELDANRRAFEMVGARMQSEGTDDQLSGLGFSTTQRNSVIVRVKGAMSRVMKVTF